MRSPLVLALLALACHSDGDPPPDSVDTSTTPVDTDTDPTVPTDTDTDDPTTPTLTLCEGDAPDVLTLFTTTRPSLVNTVDLHVTLAGEAAVAVACTRADDPSEVLLFTGESASEHTIALRGLAAASTYACELVATCPSSAAPDSFTVNTAALPAVLPETAVATPSATQSTTAPPFLLLGHDRHCAGDTARMLMFDVNGEIRWYWEGVPDVDIAYETQYLGGGLLSWGGGYYDGAPPELLDVDGNVLYVTGSPNAQSHVFHHDGKVIDSGEMMLMMIEGANDGSGLYWDGFAVGLVDPVTNDDTFYWSSQTAVDAGDLPPGSGDPWHANWADYRHDPVNGDRLYVSLCNLGDVMSVDAATGEVVWKLGDGGDLTVEYPTGELVPPGKAYPQCQHGLEFVPFAGGGGGNLLVYDNGAHGRGFSRALEYEIDEATMTATMLWAWTEPEWMEPSWGDIDYVDGDHVLITMAHACWSPNGGDVSSVVELDPVTKEVPWRLDFLDPVDAIYRAERVDACDVFPISTLCPGVQTALDALAPLLDPCSPGGTDVDEDQDGYFLCADVDCDDEDATSFPGGTEACDGADNDCDGTIDDGFVGTVFYEDKDRDGFGGEAEIPACAQPAGYAAVSGDCDDQQPAAWPANPEACDGLDNDCNGATDELEACWGCAASGSLLGCSAAVSWLDAHQVCLDLGGDLVSIDDAAENADVAALAGGEAWIGYTDQAVEGTFAWSSGSASTYTNWTSGEPNDWGGNEDCAGTNFGYFGTWNDYACDTTALPFVCER